MKKKKKVILSLSILATLILLVGILYYLMAWGFAKAVVKSVRAIDDLEQKLDSANINLVDSIKLELERQGDSSSLKVSQ